MKVGIRMNVCYRGTAEPLLLPSFLLLRNLPLSYWGYLLLMGPRGSFLDSFLPSLADTTMFVAVVRSDNNADPGALG